MDNREDDNRPEDEVTPADTDSDNDVERSEPPLDSEESDSAMSDQFDLEASSSADEKHADIDADTEDDANTDDGDPGKDWLVDTGLAAAINPQTEADRQTSDDYEMEDIADDEDSDGEEDEDALWSDDEDEGEDEDDFEDDMTALDTELPLPAPAERRSAWPMLVGGVALVLLGFGGWDLYQERATLQARVVELERNQSRVKQAVEVDAKMLGALEADNAALTLQLDNLYRDYDTAMAKLAELQSDAVQMADRMEESGVNPDDEATTVSESEDRGPVELESLSPASTAPISDKSVAGSAGEWFVNIGAYASGQSAENWSLRLQNLGYDVVVQEIQTAEDQTLKRVRLTGFGSKAAAQGVATELEGDYGTGPLWVGQLSE